LIKRQTTPKAESASLNANLEFSISQLKNSIPTFGASHSMDVMYG